jgi:hypothetical protein
VQPEMSALGQKRTFRHPLDHLVGAQYIDGGIVRRCEDVAVIARVEQDAFAGDLYERRETSVLSH